MKKDESLVHEELKGLKELFLEKFEANDKIHQLILEQTSKTNGSVAACKNDITALKQWQGFIKGGLAIMCVLVLPVLLMVARLKLGY